MAEIWVLSDGKPGHLNQSLGLAQALVRAQPSLSYEVKPLTLKWKLLTAEVAPRLIISAGRSTHLWSWLLKLRFRARNLVLMRPSLPLCCFDLALIPEHDQPKKSDRVLVTQGALNRMQPGTKVPGSHLILVGGPSKHIIWEPDFLLERIAEIQANIAGAVKLATSRRTPPEMIAAIRALGIEPILPENVSGDWLPETLAATERVWVTSDSVSMVYEALTAGCAVSLIRLKSAENSRTQSGVATLLRTGWVDESTQLAFNAQPRSLNEAQRCAQKILERGWL